MPLRTIYCNAEFLQFFHIRHVVRSLLHLAALYDTVMSAVGRRSLPLMPTFLSSPGYVVSFFFRCIPHYSTKTFSSGLCIAVVLIDLIDRSSMEELIFVLLRGLGLKVRGFLKTPNIGLPPQMSTPGCLGMSVSSARKVVCKVYLKKSLQVFVQE
jgi:hypothetical protein